MFKKKTKFSNDLTNLISKNEISLDQVIFHNNLSVTLRNGSEVLLNFIFSKENYEKVIDYALFDKKSEFPEFENFSMRQINNNAANILSYPIDKLRSRLCENEEGSDKPLLLEKFEEFIGEKSSLKSDNFYAGHFQRIFENVIMMDDSFEIFFNDKFVDKLIPFLAENVTVLAYRDLLQLFLVDYIEKIDEKTVKKIFKIVAQHAAFFSYVTYCNQPTNQNKTIELYQKNIRYFKKNQPVNNLKQAFPIPDFLNDKNAGKNLKINASIAKSNGEKFFPSKYKSKNPKNIDFEESKIKSFFFLSIIGASLIESKKIEFFDESIIEMILYCAVFSDAESLASAEAFKILRNLYYGIHINNDFNNDISDPLESEFFYKLIDKYAAFFNFDIKNLNKQQIDAFSIFWNHRYENLTDDEVMVINIDPVLNMFDFHLLPNQLTPFLYFRPLLLLDPPISSDLNTYYIMIFDFLCRKKEKLMKKKQKDLKFYDSDIQDEVRKIVFTVYEFIQRKFNFFNEDDKLKYYNALYRVIPAASSSTRTLLNGAIVQVFKKLKDSSFFIFNDRISILLTEIDDDIDYDVVQKVIEHDCENQ